MGDNTLSVAQAGQDIPASHHNELVQSQLQNLVPRNAVRAPEDKAGSLGTSVYTWLRSYIGEMFVGPAADNLKIYSDASKLVIENGSTGVVVKAELTTTGLTLYRNGVVFCSLNEAGFTSIPNYIPASSLKTKVNVFSGTYSTSDLHGSFTTVYTRVLTGLTVGKKLKWTDGGSSGRLTGSNQSAKVRWLVNGAPFFTLDQTTVPPAAGGSWSFGGNLLIPITATTMTLVLQSDNTEFRDGSYLVEEV